MSIQDLDTPNFKNHFDHLTNTSKPKLIECNNLKFKFIIYFSFIGL